MKKPQQILVVITREKPVQPALERALLFARNGPITITLFSAIYEPALELTTVFAKDHRNTLRQQYIDNRESYLKKIAQSFAAKSVTIKSIVVWHKKTAQAVVEFTQDNPIDLTVKRISSDASSENPFVMPTDWHLLRFCHSPLLLVRDEKWHPGNAILGAVCPTTECSEHQKLNTVILQYSLFLAELLNAEAHLVNTHVSPELEIPKDFPRIDLKGLKDKVNQFHFKSMQKLIAEHPFNDRHIHNIEGLPEEKIPLTAERIQAQLVVMGTVGRTGLTAAFMGNTAERVLARLKGEVLALKPENFEV